MAPRNLFVVLFLAGSSFNYILSLRFLDKIKIRCAVFRYFHYLLPSGASVADSFQPRAAARSRVDQLSAFGGKKAKKDARVALAEEKGYWQVNNPCLNYIFMKY